MLRSLHVLGLLAVVTVLSATACGDEGGVVAVESNTMTTDTTGSVAPETSGTDETSNSSDTPDTGGTGTTDPGTVDTNSPRITWTDSNGAVQEGTIEVHRDYSNPAAGTFTLFLTRHRAVDGDKRVGTLLVNPGGPGAAGSDFARYAEDIYDPSLLETFDIVGWDPRGTGQSTPAVDCVDDYDTYFSIDSSPDDPAEQQAILDAATEFGQECVRNSGAILPYVSTENSTRDMDSIRRALGEDTISYFGFSYGSELGATWASLFPDTVRAMVIDGAADQTVGYLQQNLEQAAGFEATFQTFLDQCSADPGCAFYNGGDAGAAYDQLSAQVDANPVPTVTGRPAVTQGVLVTAVVDALYSQSSWDLLAGALADLQNGDGGRILDLYDDYYGRQVDGSYSNELEAYFAINCLDDPGTKDPQQVFAMQDEFAAAAPRLGPSYMSELEFSAEWPEAPAPPVAIDTKGAGPVVVIGTTGDPATPLESTRHMADALEDGRLIVVTADQHTGYRVNDCVDNAVDAYLIDLQPPADGLICDH